MVRDMTPDVERMRAAASSGYSTATDIADWLVRRLGMPFRQAHHVTGRIVALAASRGAELEQLSLEDLRTIDPAFEQDALDILAVEKSVASRTSFGGTAPRNVETQAEAWLARLRDDRRG